ncbi:helix-turn-helix transcriptional regulator [Alcaligenes nematophilus]|uniref:Helix-turn-helix transcriptional regulator n=1 Tax=Alcaligenes nematophilus TaxID=2994643 RepID=A0ABU3MQH3_9BURK|nr:helix-turn-helix transcriptional regulator [Alcaligenes nematophilus]MDT8464696.1 helix-turn-helix transcriptional regulator [Alcaligenes nematophilus]MDT8469290.1 helix-turn-helix transcriptional regulator [Alcaligenes nematophilus]MDT8502925.1 helix-turn-helix transcriptional regulator [Alcaligenes nematophilus]MDT8524782.1 helix-turn-helix transcriptional regulator [Alcaligenes nematophilus]
MTDSENKNAPRSVISRPVDRALLRLGRDISAARRARRLSQEDLAQRIGTSLSTVRRMEDGNAGTALHTFLSALHVLGRLNDVTKVMTMENDALGMDLLREQLPQRVRRPRRIKADQTSGAKSQYDSASVNPDKLEGF